MIFHYLCVCGLCSLLSIVILSSLHLSSYNLAPITMTTSPNCGHQLYVKQFNVEVNRMLYILLYILGHRCNFHTIKHINKAGQSRFFDITNQWSSWSITTPKCETGKQYLSVKSQQQNLH